MLLTEFVLTPDGAIQERLPEDEGCGRILIFGLEGEMLFGSGQSLEEHLEAIEGRVTPDTPVVVFRMKRARSPDAVGMALLERSVDRRRVRQTGTLLAIAHACQLVSEACAACPQRQASVRERGICYVP
jgi:hypothetical protein